MFTPHRLLALSVRRRRPLLWGVLISLLAVALSLLVWMTLNYEINRSQESLRKLTHSLSGQVQQNLNRVTQNLLVLSGHPLSEVQRLSPQVKSALESNGMLLRIEWRMPNMQLLAAYNKPGQHALLHNISPNALSLETASACSTAALQLSPSHSKIYFVPQTTGTGTQVLDTCIPVIKESTVVALLTASISLQALLENSAGLDVLSHYELAFINSNGTRLTRAGVFSNSDAPFAERIIELPGQPLTLRIYEKNKQRQLVPNLTTGLVIGLSLMLSVVVVLLVKDVQRRGRAERALSEALAFRKAMEDSLITGLRARDRQGQVTYVNPAFCKMVGFEASELVGSSHPPYWPPELLDEYTQRHVARMAWVFDAHTPPQVFENFRQGFETTFLKKNGARIEVLIFEAPLIDSNGLHTGWMSATLDVTEQRKIEELNRQQQERLAATSRLATVGEMASLLSHELNQPLAAIASYAHGSLNMLKELQPRDEEIWELIQQALKRMADQAERAGKVIQSVHNYVRRREQAREAWPLKVLIETVMPLIRLQARKNNTQIELDLPPSLPKVFCDRTMIEQVLLNLARNGIQAMSDMQEGPARLLVISAARNENLQVEIKVTDRGPGIPTEIQNQLFTPFFTTRTEGMGLGLSLCRTVIEQHGGALEFRTRTKGDLENPSVPIGTEFRFSLPTQKDYKIHPFNRPPRRGFAL
jgi:two-component system, LuxR family, sensor histidine kinase DctS